VPGRATCGNNDFEEVPAMRRFQRAILLITAVVAVAIVVLKTSGVWQRFKDEQFVEEEVKPTGWLARSWAWAAPWAWGWLYAIFARLLELQPEDEVLDVACGSGTFLRKHAAHVARVAGLDHSEDLIDIARQENRERVAAGTAEFVVGDAAALPWANDEFSVVTSNCINCFEKKAALVLGEMYRVLRPGGRAVVADNRRQTMEAVGFARVSTQHYLWGHVTMGFKE
jgi:SAM-dependent methyltransferase